MQILEDGNLTDSKGKKVNFKNTIIIMTSNIGSNILDKKENIIGFKEKNEDSSREKVIDNDTKLEVMKEIEKVFKKEFLNRIDEIIIFNKLSDDVILKIIEKYFKDLECRFKEAGYNISIKCEVSNIILESLLKKENGARDIKRKIKEIVEEKIVDVILENNLEKNIEIAVENKNNNVEISF